MLSNTLSLCISKSSEVGVYVKETNIPKMNLGMHACSHWENWRKMIFPTFIFFCVACKVEFRKYHTIVCRLVKIDIFFIDTDKALPQPGHIYWDEYKDETNARQYFWSVNSVRVANKRQHYSVFSSCFHCFVSTAPDRKRSGRRRCITSIQMLGSFHSIHKVRRIVSCRKFIVLSLLLFCVCSIWQ